MYLNHLPPFFWFVFYTVQLAVYDTCLNANFPIPSHCNTCRVVVANLIATNVTLVVCPLLKK